MSLALIVGATVLVLLAVTGAVGYLLEQSAERHDRPHDHRRPGAPTAPE